MGEEHGLAVYGGSLRNIERNQAWLVKRQAIERERENQGRERAAQEDG
jgi:hypothetical protein